MVAAPVIGEISDRHEVDELGGVPEVEGLGVRADQVAADEDVHDAADEGDFLAEGDGFRVVPLLAQLLDALLHALPIPLELFVGRGHSSPPFFHHALPCFLAPRLEGSPRLPHLFRLCGDTPLQLLQLLWQSKVVEQIQDGQAIQRREGVPVIVVGAAAREGMSA